MEIITVKKQVYDKRFEYLLFKGEESIASLKGVYQNESYWWLRRYEAFSKEEKEHANELQKALYNDCLENKASIRFELNDRTEEVKQFMEQSDFVEAHINYVFEHTLKNIEEPPLIFDLSPLKSMDLSKYQEIYYDSSIGDPQIDLTNLSPKEFYEQDKKELDQLWQEDLMYTVSYDNEILGVLNFRTMKKPGSEEKEGAINYLGLLPSQRRKGYGKILHLTGLKKLKDLGCVSYYGGTDSLNKAMLKIFQSNNCERAETQYCYKISK